MKLNMFLSNLPFLILCFLGSLSYIALGNELLISYISKPENCSDLNNIAKKGDIISVHYTGTIDETSKNGIRGKVFDTSLKRGKPFTFTLGSGQVIKGTVNICIYSHISSIHY